MRRLLPFLKAYRVQITLGPLFKLIEALIELMLPLLMARIIDFGINRGDPAYIRRQGVWMLLLVLAAVLFSFSCQYMASVASQGVGTKLRNALFIRIQKMTRTEAASFGTSSLINRVNGDVNQVQVLVAMSIRLLSRSPILAVGGVIMSFLISWQLAVILLLAVPAAAVILAFIMRASTRIMKKALVQSDKVTELFTENIAGARVIRAFAKEAHERGYFAKKADQLAVSWIQANRVSGLMNPLTNFIFNAVIVYIIWRSGRPVDTGQITQGEVLALVNYMTLIVQALMVWAGLASLFPRSLAAADRLAEVLDEDLSSKPADPHKTNQSSAEAKPDVPILEASGLTFTYPAARTASLTDISFAVHQGEELGIIGATGSGKTTLTRLVLGFYPPDSGHLKFLGKEISEWDPAELRRRVAWVPQKAVLMQGTIRSNLLFGIDPAEEGAESLVSGSVKPKRKPNPAEDERLWKALEAAQAADFVRELDGGLDAVVERGGQNFSGGQRQRLTIARALMRQAQLYILDDSTSALDYRTDARLRQALAAYTVNAAVVRISHRVYQIRRSDMILVLEDGKMAGYGKHADLKESSLIYREIVESQEGGVRAEVQA